MTWSRRDLFKRVGAVAGAAFVGYSTKARATTAVEDQGWKKTTRADRFVDYQGREFLMVRMERDVQEGGLVMHGDAALGVALADAPNGHFAFIQTKGPAQVNVGLPMDPPVMALPERAPDWEPAG